MQCRLQEFAIMGRLDLRRVSDKASNPRFHFETMFNELTTRRSRIACVWFLVAQVATVKMGISCSILDTWRELLLPCHKVQWGATTTESWDEETKALGTLPKRGKDMTCFGELLESHRRASDAVHAETLDRWNSGVDDIGLLLNLVTVMM